MSKVICYSDIHHGTLIGKLGSNDVDLRVEDALDVERQVTQYCLDHGIDTVLFCGDRFRSRNPSVWLFNMVEEVWFDRADKGIETFALVGNHDQYRIVGHGSNYSVLWNKKVVSDRVHVIEQPSTITIKDKAFGFVPFGYSLCCADWKVDLIVFHDELQGFKDDRGYIGRSGFSTKELRQTCKFFLSGHIHAFADVHGQGLIVGAPYQMDMLDVGIRKGFLVFDTETFEHEFVETRVPKIVRIDVLDDTDVVKEQEVAGNYVYCRTSRNKMDAVKDKLKRFEARAFRVDEIVDKGMFVEAFARKVYEARSGNEMIHEYIDSRDVPNKLSLREKGCEIWQEVAG